MKSYYLGVDVGSVSTNLILINENNEVIYKKYLRTQGKPIDALQTGMKEIIDDLGEIEIKGVGATGSGRHLASMILGADIVKNEITAHAVSAIDSVEDVKTILEIGGQDSKIIIIKDGIVTDFAMNTVCAAGTGSFLDRQASRLGVDISDFGKLALISENPVRIAGRCAVFAESDMIHKQQLGHNQQDIIRGLCEALVRNYLSNVGKGKEILDKVAFQGGVAANEGIKKAFEDALGLEIVVPKNFDVMGAIGVAILAKEEVKDKGKTNFKGINIANNEYKVKGIDCGDCANICEVIEIVEEDCIIARYGDKCGKWTNGVSNRKRNLA
ncbi:activator of (R)-2-hydroxyglutaryl-CoA dehydratase HgdC [Gottschalkia acidurici 9a]|uniref:Activator of (R)-2-hydroxyglutaryl-CoA dehydratase HgdC n=1 Tax=Gottschalkia acidurici (strain ATCC 7906 / DSM 604 / BCRC 14475 / CIP 104303 / KCTC 5404 / NCIMB 10678 / 9a) TaxID=1128398 RepID=K0B013_GOTA9|nr:acyl-CoA dehydratase activase [Gottschalkia acidurici]AFS77956.1 activator of (R)-2-hydroxyglutaryl-CoA dehydratase HgdC [Gottschalkia acidurici 9a]